MCICAYLAQQLAVRGQISGPDRCHDIQLQLHAALLPRRCGGERGDDVLAELVGDHVNGGPAAMPIVHTVERLQLMYILLVIMFSQRSGCNT